MGPGPGPFAKLLNEFVSQRSYFLLAELIMARRNASELIMDISAMNNELMMARRNASEFIMAISAMNNIFNILVYLFYIILFILNIFYIKFDRKFRKLINSLVRVTLGS